MGIIQIGIISILGITLASLLKSQKTEYSIYVIAGISIFILAYVLGMVRDVKGKLDFLTDIVSGNEHYYSMLFKMMGITYLCEFCAGICKDAGYQGLAGQVEMFGKLSIVFSGLPIFFALIETIQNL